MSQHVKIVCGFCGAELRRGQDCPTCSPVLERSPATRFQLAVSTAVALSYVAPVVAGETREQRLARCLRAATGGRGSYEGRSSS